MGLERADFLRARAAAFLEAARSDLSRGDYDLVLFHAEQAIQLCLKHLIFSRVGDFPKAHSLVRLIREALKLGGIPGLRELYEENLEMIYLLEEAYISSRYLPHSYGRDIAERALRFAEHALGVLGCLRRA